MNKNYVQKKVIKSYIHKKNYVQKKKVFFTSSTPQSQRVDPKGHVSPRPDLIR